VRIDRAIAPPGLIRNAAAYSLFTTDRGLYLIKTGRGWRINFEPRGGLNRFAARKTADRIKRKLTEVEQALNDGELDAELQRRKGSLFITRSELTEIEIRTEQLPELRFRANGKKYRLEFEQDRRGEVEAFVAALLS
jgi:hypothetical protein